MADDYQIRSTGNWWDPSRNNGPSPSSTSFGWSSMDSVSVSDSSSVFGDTQKLKRSDSSGGGGVVLAADPNLQMMGLGLSSQSMDWNQPLHCGSGKAERSFHALLQEDHMSTNKNYNQESGISTSSISQDQWRQKINSADSEHDSLASDFMRTKRGLSLDQPQFVSHDNSTFPMDSAVYGSSSSTMFKGLFGSDDHPQQPGFENPTMNFPYQSNYVMNSGEPVHGQLQFTNNAPFWNASMAAMNNLQSSFFSSLPTQFSTPTFDEKPKNPSQLQDLGTVGKKSNNEPSTKRARSETTSTVPAAFKVRKEKMGDKITALQQLVSPFGKTDTASVLSEAIEYIKFLHEQVNVLSIPYMKSGAPIQHQQSSNKTKDPEGPKQDLRSRGLCLVPVSSTFPVTQETTVDFWTPTFGSTFR